MEKIYTNLDLLILWAAALCTICFLTTLIHHIKDGATRVSTGAKMFAMASGLLSLAAATTHLVLG